MVLAALVASLSACGAAPAPNTSKLVAAGGVAAKGFDLAGAIERATLDGKDGHVEEAGGTRRPRAHEIPRDKPPDQI
jgi:hypothetical protein